MSEAKALSLLIEKVRDGEANGKFGPIMSAYWDLSTQICAVRAYNGSLDAARNLHDELLPGWGWNVGYTQGVQRVLTTVWAREAEQDEVDATSTDPARAWLLAILKAKLSEVAE